ncbi:YtxH domain-containing protein [Neobacillus sp. SM06]|uniref:YtxH domain-containing protein n=1 Tax=Neobacillus sp. SM06 TaxID=3422492 RepID=UPI003D2E11B9
MANSNKFWKGMLIGALAGGALSLLDKETRAAMKENWKRAAHGTAEMVRNPKQVTSQIKETAQRVRTTVEQVGEDLAFIAEKVEELKETTPQVTKLLKETKDTFTKKEDDLDNQQVI